MRAAWIATVVLSCPTILSAWTADAAPDTKTTTFAVMRNESQIGTDTISISNNGADTTVQTVTHVEVKLGFLTLYHFDQTATERWSNGQFLAMRATTDDNGTRHSADANNTNGTLVVQCDGKSNKFIPAMLPLNLWNTRLLQQSAAFNPLDGSAVKISVSDRGEDTLTLEGHSIHAHHYVVTTTFVQDVWYDESNRLVKVAFKGKDGSTIYYQLV